MSGRGGRRNFKDKNGKEVDDGFGHWGGYMAAKQAKLLDQFHDDKIEKLSNIFEGVRILVNGFTNPSAAELKALMAAHGGEYHMYQSSSTTHIIASNLPNVKIKHLGAVPVVKPAWIVESIALNRLLDYSNYLLYTNQSRLQPALKFEPTKTASDPKFLEEFYNNSRLHLISTLGAEFKQLVNQLREESTGQFPARAKIAATSSESAQSTHSSIIMHIDMDCFFVSVGLRNHPELKGKPLAITHAKSGTLSSNNPLRQQNIDREVALYEERLPGGAPPKIVDVKDRLDGLGSLSEIASCNYEARKFGIKNGMFLGQAVKLCPDLKTLPYDFEGYREVSHSLYNTVASYTLDIEAVSCDEMYVDVKPVLVETRLSVEEFASEIRKEIMKITGCPCSTGFGANRLQARLATRKAKPAGQFYLKPEHVEEYMSEIALADLPGVGRATLSKLQKLGFNNCSDIQQNGSLKLLQNELGTKAGEKIWHQAHGRDNKPLDFNHERKSVSAEINYGIRFKALEESYNFLKSLSEEVYNRLSEINMRAKGLTLKLLVRAEGAPVETAKFLGHGVCDAITKSSTSNLIYSNAEVIFKEAKSIYDKLNVDYTELRGVGIQLTKLEKPPPINTALINFLKQGAEKPTKIDHEIPSTSKPTTKFIKSSRKPATSSAMDNFLKMTKPRVASLKKAEINLDILKELPEDIRMEVIKEYELDTKLPQPPTKIVIETKPSPLRGQTWNQVKLAIKSWIQSETHPAQVDVDMLAAYLRDLALERKIEILHEGFNFLHRIFTPLSCSWHKVYYHLIDATQQGMLTTYGMMLHIQNGKFTCCAI